MFNRVIDIFPSNHPRDFWRGLVEKKITSMKSGVDCMSLRGGVVIVLNFQQDGRG